MAIANVFYRKPFGRILLRRGVVSTSIAFCFLTFGLAIPHRCTAGPVAPSEFLYRLSRAELIKKVSAPVDTFWERDDHGVDHKTLVFVPVDFVGLPAIAHARLSNDSLGRIDFYVLYHEHKGVKPFMPYDRMGFTKASIDDFVRLRNTLTKLYGEPTIMAETFFEYMPSVDRPYIVANFKEGMVDVSITPISAH